MSQTDYETFKKTGKVPATGETFISPTQDFSEGYDGVLVEFKVHNGTTDALLDIGVGDSSMLVNSTYDLPTVQKG